MNKRILIPVFALMLVATVFAVGYYVNSVTIKTDVYEPFQVSYAIIGDAGNWDGETTCATYEGTYSVYETGFELDVGGLYAGEGRMVCVKINNLAEADISYTIASEVLNTNEETNTKCVSAFGNHEKTGTAANSAETVDGTAIVVSQDSEPVNDCRIKVSVSRG